MSNFKVLLKYMEKMGYPNKNSSTIFTAAGYNPENLMRDLVSNLGEEGAKDFVNKTFRKLSDVDYETRIRIDMEDCGYENSYFFLKIYTIFVDLNIDGVEIQADTGGGQLLLVDEDGEGTKMYKYEDLSDVLGMGDWNEIEDEYRRCSEEFIYKYCRIMIDWG